MPSTRVRVSTEPIDHAELVELVASPAAGATVLFLGTVRSHSEGREGITHLVYEVYREEVERVIRSIVDEACARWPLEGVAVDHLTGTVTLGEASVGIAVSSAHRADAFAAASYVIDELKRRAPIWKKEHWVGGAEWSKGS